MGIKEIPIPNGTLLLLSLHILLIIPCGIVNIVAVRYNIRRKMPCMQLNIPDYLRVSDDEIDRELDRLFEELRWIQLTAERLNAELAGSTPRCGCINAYHPPHDPISSISTSEASSSSSSSSETRRRRIFPLFRY